MVFVISFPNLLCLLLTGIFLVHFLSRDPTMGSFQELPDNLEVIYCRLPQSYRVDDSMRCSSTQKLFILLGNDCSMEKKRKKRRDSEALQNETKTDEAKEVHEEAGSEDGYDEVVTVEVVDEVEVEEEKEEVKEEMTSPFVGTVISLLVCSAIVSLLEWYRERKKTPDQQGPGIEGNGMEAALDRRFSLADLTVNRHNRRKDSQQLETIRQNSISSGTNKPPPLIRRSSFPAQFPEQRSRHAPTRQQSTPGLPSARRMSIDLSEDESPDRRRVRIIRRH